MIKDKNAARFYDPNLVVISKKKKIAEKSDDKSRTDADDEETGVNHGNTKIPFGLCQREGIDIQPGWTPADAWKALEGKGYSVSEIYKELKETGKVSKKKRTFADIQKEYDDNRVKLKAAIKRRDKAEKDFEMSISMQVPDDDTSVDDATKQMFKKDLKMTQDRYRDAMKEVDELTKKDKALKQEIDAGGDEERESRDNAIRTGVTSFVRNEKVVKAISGMENLIRNQSYESGTCVDKNGNKIFDASDGERSSIDLSQYAERLKDTVFTHNHPSGTTFSVEDLSSAVRCGMAELRACHSNGAYSLVRQYSLDGEKPDKYRYFAWDYQEAIEKYKKDVVDDIWRKGPQVQEVADKCNNMVAEYRRKWLKDNSKQYGWIYTEESK